jgi:hypothetical protein
MTPLKPIEDLTVKGREHGPSRYALPEICQHPDCTEPATSKHHCWPKGMLKGDYWWVEIKGVIVANVIALCGDGTTGHHGDVEDHRSWIRFEDGVFNWYDREPVDLDYTTAEEWRLVGPLNPQPGDTLGRKKRSRKQGEERRQRRTISVKVPADRENGGALWDELIEQTREKLIKDDYKDADKLPIYETIMAGLYGYIRS